MSGVLTETVAPALGAVVATMLFLGPLPAVLQARRRGNLGGLSPALFPWIVANCYAFLAYGVIKQDVFIVMSNVAGFYLGLFYLLIGHRLASTQRLAATLEALFIGLGVLWGALTVAARWAPESAEALVGNGAMTMSLCMFAAPLGTMRQVLRERNTVYINLGFLSGQVASCVLWSVYGMATQDVYIIVPNVTGLVFGLTQTFLVCTLPRKSAFQLPQHAVPVSDPVADKMLFGSAGPGMPLTGAGASVNVEVAMSALSPAAPLTGVEHDQLPLPIQVGTMPPALPTVDAMTPQSPRSPLGPAPASPTHMPASPRHMPSRHASAAQGEQHFQLQQEPVMHSPRLAALHTMPAQPVADMSSPLVTPLGMLEPQQQQHHIDLSHHHHMANLPPLALDADVLPPAHYQHDAAPQQQLPPRDDEPPRFAELPPAYEPVAFQPSEQYAPVHPQSSMDVDRV